VCGHDGRANEGFVVHPVLCGPDVSAGFGPALLTVALSLADVKRHAFKMKLKPGVVAEYKRRHDEIWPELAQALHAAGIFDYSIFLDEETLTLFAVQKQTDNNTVAGLPNHPIVKKWWASMAPLMETNPDNSPQCGELKEVFHLD
jgi:L-rhamnose mutarotase